MSLQTNLGFLVNTAPRKTYNKISDYYFQLLLLLLLLLLHDLYRANFENRVRGAGVARWRT